MEIIFQKGRKYSFQDKRGIATARGAVVTVY